MLTHLKEIYAVENVISRHTAWTAVLIGNRAPGVPLNDWLDYMHALAYSFIQAGTSKQRKKGLSVKQRGEYLSVIGKQISDGEGNKTEG